MDHSQNPTESAPRRLRVAAVQMVFAHSIGSNLEKIERAATLASKAGADVVLFPECATTGYACDFGSLKSAAIWQALRTVAALALRLRVHLLVGSPVFAGRCRYNALVVFDRRGRLVHTYARCQLTDPDRQWFTPRFCLLLFTDVNNAFVAGHAMILIKHLATRCRRRHDRLIP